MQPAGVGGSPAVSRLVTLWQRISAQSRLLCEIQSDVSYNITAFFHSVLIFYEFVHIPFIVVKVV
jgi:hypothetical protein